MTVWWFFFFFFCKQKAAYEFEYGLVGSEIFIRDRGGGPLLDPQPRRRHRRLRPDVAERFRALAQGTPEELLLATIARSGSLPTATLLERAGVSPDEGAPEVARLVAAGQLLSIGKSVVTPTYWQALQARALDELAQYHAAAPLRPGMEREELRSRLQLTPPLFAALRESLLTAGTVAESGSLLRLTDHRVSFSEAQAAAVARLNALLTTQGVNSPSVKECKALVGEPLYFALVDLGQLRPINDEVVYALPTYTDPVSYTHLRAHETVLDLVCRLLLEKKTPHNHIYLHL